MAVVSRAPLAKIEPFKARKGWTFPWYSSYGSDFNYDFHVTLDEAVARSSTTTATATSSSPTGFATRAASCTARASSCATATRSFTPIRPTPAAPSRSAERHYYLDMTALGRQEDWEEPRGRSTGAPRAGEAGAGET